MSKNKLAEKALKAFLKSIKKIKSIDIKKGLSESGKVLSKLTLVANSKKSDSKKKKESKKVKPEAKTKSKDKSTKGKTTVKKVDPKSKSKKSETKAKIEKPSSPKKKVEEKPKSAIVSKPTTAVKPPVTVKAAAPKKVEEKLTAMPAATAKIVTTKPVVGSTPNPAKKIVTTRRTAKVVVGDNLKLIEGIGPKIESFLKEDGTDTFEKLSKANADDIKKMMVEKGGTRYNANNPSTWPEQAALAAKGDMEGLKALKEELKGGIKPA